MKPSDIVKFLHRTEQFKMLLSKTDTEEMNDVLDKQDHHHSKTHKMKLNNGSCCCCCGGGTSKPEFSSFMRKSLNILNHHNRQQAKEIQSKPQASAETVKDIEKKFTQMRAVKNWLELEPLIRHLRLWYNDLIRIYNKNKQAAQDDDSDEEDEDGDENDEIEVRRNWFCEQVLKPNSMQFLLSWLRCYGSLPKAIVDYSVTNSWHPYLRLQVEILQLLADVSAEVLPRFATCIIQHKMCQVLLKLLAQYLQILTPSSCTGSASILSDSSGNESTVSFTLPINTRSYKTDVNEIIENCVCLLANIAAENSETRLSLLLEPNAVRVVSLLLFPQPNMVSSTTSKSNENYENILRLVENLLHLNRAFKDTLELRRETELKMVQELSVHLLCFLRRTTDPKLIFRCVRVFKSMALVSSNDDLTDATKQRIVQQCLVKTKFVHCIVGTVSKYIATIASQPNQVCIPQKQMGDDMLETLAAGLSCLCFDFTNAEIPTLYEPIWTHSTVLFGRMVALLEQGEAMTSEARLEESTLHPRRYQEFLSFASNVLWGWDSNCNHDLLNQDVAQLEKQLAPLMRKLLLAIVGNLRKTVTAPVDATTVEMWACLYLVLSEAHFCHSCLLPQPGQDAVTFITLNVFSNHFFQLCSQTLTKQIYLLQTVPKHAADVVTNCLLLMESLIAENYRYKIAFAANVSVKDWEKIYALQDDDYLLSLDDFQDKEETLDTLERLNAALASSHAALASSQVDNAALASAPLLPIQPEVGPTTSDVIVSQEVWSEASICPTMSKPLNNRDRKKLKKALEEQLQNNATTVSAFIPSSSDSSSGIYTTTPCIASTSVSIVSRCALRDKCAELKKVTGEVRSIRVQCTESCSVEYHYPLCWKTIVNNRWSQKDELNQEKMLPCLTPDCSGDIKLLRYMDNETILRVVRKHIALKKPAVTSSTSETAAVRKTQLQIRPKKKEGAQREQKMIVSEEKTICLDQHQDHDHGQLFDNSVLSLPCSTSSSALSCSPDYSATPSPATSETSERDEKDEKREDSPAQLLVLPDEEDEFKELMFWQSRGTLKLPDEMEREDEMRIAEMQEKVENQLKQLFDESPQYYEVKTELQHTNKPATAVVQYIPEKPKPKHCLSLMLLGIPIDWTEANVIQLLNMLFAPVRNGPKVNHFRVSVVQSLVQGRYGYITCKYAHQVKLVQHLFQQHVRYQRQSGEFRFTNLWNELQLVSSAL